MEHRRDIQVGGGCVHSYSCRSRPGVGLDREALRTRTESSWEAVM